MTHLRGGAELLISLHDLVHAVQKVLLAHALPPRADGEHPRLGAHAVELGPRGARAQTRDELEPYVPIAVHALRVYLQDVAPPLQVR